ncbi:MAG: glycosyl hydrolase, partial [Bacteroidetes bacterium]|nr:glycosyl hydrolase [Bacteroidota bacterium]
MKRTFASPGQEFWPGVYWYFMDGNMSREGITKDLESMASAGVGNVVFLEVNVGIPRGEVEFLSDQWQELFLHAEREADRLGIDITLGIGPGWTGSGGPWVNPESSMKHLIYSVTTIDGPSSKDIRLPKPVPLKPYFGEESLTPELKNLRDAYYEDVAVLAFRTSSIAKIPDILEKALYYRGPYSSAPGIRPYFIQSYAGAEKKPEEIKTDNILDLTSKLKGDKLTDWKVPDGNWTILRFGMANNGAVTRPAPVPGLGFESDKFDSVSLARHLQEFPGKLLDKIGRRDSNKTGGLKMLHMDSWEMGSQNWSRSFREEFMRRRGYDPLPYLPAYGGYVTVSAEISERFLWDMRLTSQELVVDQHASYVKRYARKYGLGLSIEPYDMNPAADLELGAVADVPMSEFWSKGYGFNTVYSCMEAASIGHLQGHATIAAESFTAESDGWNQYPGSMKNQSDWAFAAGINKFVIHTFQHQPFHYKIKPGMTMGPYGVHWDRNQTWWPMAQGYHQYVARCQYMLRQGKPVADILYLTPEGAPHVFLPPRSALAGDAFLPDKRGFSFDGCWPSQLYEATVREGAIIFPGGAKYAVLVLPIVGSISEKLLTKIIDLAAEGATVIGNPYVRSQGLSGY